MASSSSSASADDRKQQNGGGSGSVPARTHAEWAASMPAYYAGGQPYAAAWPAPQQQQHLMVGAAAAYGAPVPFPVYHHHPAYYAQASMAAVNAEHLSLCSSLGLPYMADEVASAVAEGNNKRRIRRAPSGEDDPGSDSGDEGSQASPEKRAAGADEKGSSSAKRTKTSPANDKGEPSQAATTQNAITEIPFMAKGRPASKLSVSAPGRAALPSATPNLNIGMALWSTSPSTVIPSGQGDVNAEDSSQSNGSLSRLDERELKRERRKQSNRKSARRSRLRKQQECEELTQKVTELTAANGTLRSELDQLKKECEDMKAENDQLMEEILAHDDEMMQSEDSDVETTLSMHVDASQAHNGKNGKLHRNRNSGSKE